MKKIIIILPLALLWFVSCKNKNCELPQQTPGSGEIIADALLKRQPTSQPGSVVPPGSWIYETNHIIKSDSQNVYFNFTVSFDNGNTYTPIDFTQYSVLGKYASGTCTAVFERNVSRNEAKKECVYKIKVYQCGNCERNWGDMNWVLVPKIPDDYTVLFMVE